MKNASRLCINYTTPYTSYILIFVQKDIFEIKKPYESVTRTRTCGSAAAFAFFHYTFHDPNSYLPKQKSESMFFIV